MDISQAPPDTSFELGAFPNPFNSRVTLIAQGKASSAASKLILVIYNIRGQQVYFQHIAYPQPAAITWNAETELGQSLSSAVYWAVLKGPQG